MARPKAAIEVAGRSMLRIGLEALSDAESVHVIGHSGSPDVDLEPVPDEVPGMGPLGGIATALAMSSQPTSVVISCDLPMIDATAVRALVAALDDADVAVPLVDGRPQWAVGAWRTDVALELEAAIRRGERSIRALSRRLRVAYLLGTDSWYRDVDTPEELAELR